MKKYILKCALVAVPISFFGCGDDITQNSIVKSSDYASEEELPSCTSEMQGTFATIISKGSIYVCSDQKWKSLGGQSEEYSCSTETFADKSGLKIICNGDSVGVILNGMDGKDGKDGKDGVDGKDGADGKDATVDTTATDPQSCIMKDSGHDVLLFICGDSVYSATMNRSILDTWNGSSKRHIIYGAGDTIGHFYGASYDDNPYVTGSIEWSGDVAWSNWLNGEDVLAVNGGFVGKAILENKQDVSLDVYRPFVGINAEFKTQIDGYAGGGFCLTYASNNDMGLVVSEKYSEDYYRATIPATGGDTVVLNILLSDFEAVGILKYGKSFPSKIGTILLEVVGSDKKGKYETEFGFWELGAYGKCSGRVSLPEEPLSSSSSEQSSSSSESVCISVDFDPDTSFCDDRDGKVYKKVAIGKQVWMAENMNYDMRGGYCYANEEENCDKYGRLYTIEAAQQACPAGWHLPALAEFDSLVKVAGGQDIAGKVLKAGSGWESDAGGLDTLHFSLLPAGGNPTGSFDQWLYMGIGSRAYLWTSSEAENVDAPIYMVFDEGDAVSEEEQFNPALYSVRCIMD